MPQSSEFIKQLESDCHQFLQQDSQSQKPIIAAWGLVKAGKSSLLNMLSDHIKDEFFKTGAVRTTTLNQELETDHYLLMDTPGLGIDQADSKEAYSGLENADVILFVHAPPGELDQEEMQLLMQLKMTYTEDVEQRLVLVITQLDKDHDGALERTRQRILEQLQEKLEIQPQCFLVSNSRYRKGAAEGKKTMIDSSGIPRLRAYLHKLAHDIDGRLNSVRIQRRAAHETKLLIDLKKSLKNECQAAQDLQLSYLHQVQSFNRMMAELRQNFVTQTARISETQRKLKTIQEKLDNF